MSYFSIKSALTNSGKGGLPLNITDNWGFGIQGIQPQQRSVQLQRKEYVDTNSILKDQHHFFDSTMDTEFIQKYERGVNPSVKVVIPSQQSGTQNQFNKINQDMIINQHITQSIDQYGRRPRKTTSLMSTENKSGLRPTINNDINGKLAIPLQNKISQSIEGFKTRFTQPQLRSFFSQQYSTKDRIKSSLIEPNKKKIVKKIDFKIRRNMSDGLYKNVNTNKTFIVKEGQHNKTSLQNRMINNDKTNTEINPIMKFIPKRTNLDPSTMINNSVQSLLRIKPDVKKKFKTNHDFMKSIINITNKTNNKQHHSVSVPKQHLSKRIRVTTDAFKKATNKTPQHVKVDGQKQFLSKQTDHGTTSLFENHFNNKIKISAESKKKEKPKWLTQGTLSRFKKNTRSQIQTIKADSLKSESFRKQIIPDHQKSFKKEIQDKIKVYTSATKTFIPKTQDINDQTSFHNIRNKNTNPVSVSLSKNPLYNKTITFNKIQPKLNRNNINTRFEGKKQFTSKSIDINDQTSFKSVRTKNNLNINVETHKKGMDKKVVHLDTSRLKSILKNTRTNESINTNHKKMTKKVTFNHKKPKSVKHEPLHITQVKTNVSKHPKHQDISIQDKHYTKQGTSIFNVNTAVTKQPKSGAIKTHYSEKTKTKTIPKQTFTGREQGRFKTMKQKQYNTMVNKIKKKDVKSRLYTIPEVGKDPNIKHSMHKD